MVKTRKLTPHLQNEIFELRKSRNKIEEFEYKFLSNFYENCKFIHYQIQSKIPKELFWVGYRQYLVFLVSSVETFFRDLFVYLVSRDKAISTKIIQDIQIKQTEINKLNSDEETAEFLSSCFNFQSFDDINLAFSKILNTDFWSFLENYEIENCVIGRQIGNFKLIEFNPDWKKTFNESLNLRHKVIHNANFRPKQNISLIREAESLFLVIPQIINYSFAKKFNLNYDELTFGEGKAYSYIFSIEDILSDDWEVCDKNEPGLRHTASTR